MSLTAHDPSIARDEQPRLNRQTQAVLARLQSGPATNFELSAVALKYTSRISDLRASGYRVEIVERDHATGRVLYALGGVN